VDESRAAELGRDRAGGPQQRLVFEPRERGQSILVERLGGELADRGMQAPGLAQEQAAVGRYGLVLAEQVLERRRLRAGRVARLLRLLELLRIAEQHEAL